jgi:hypothetical protein
MWPTGLPDVWDGLSQQGILCPIKSPRNLSSACWRGTLDDLEPRLTRHGYNAKTLAELLHVGSTDVRAFLAGRLPPVGRRTCRRNASRLGSRCEPVMGYERGLSRLFAGC